MKLITVIDYKTNDTLGKTWISDEKLAEYEARCGNNPSGAVRLADWLSGEALGDITAQDDAVVYFA